MKKEHATSIPRNVDATSGVPRSTLGHACTAGCDDVVARGIELLLELAARRHGALWPCHPPRPAAHLAQRLDDGRDDFGRGPVHPPAGLRHDQAAGFFDRSNDARDVERHQAAKVDDCSDTGTIEPMVISVTSRPGRRTSASPRRMK